MHDEQMEAEQEELEHLTQMRDSIEGELEALII